MSVGSCRWSACTCSALPRVMMSLTALVGSADVADGEDCEGVGAAVVGAAVVGVADVVVADAVAAAVAGGATASGWAASEQAMKSAGTTRTVAAARASTRRRARVNLEDES